MLTRVRHDAVWFDEFGSIPPRRSKTVQPLDIACGSCGAESGRSCFTRYGRKANQGRKPHYRRKEDARTLTVAVQALT